MYKLYAKGAADKMMMTLSLDIFFSQAHTDILQFSRIILYIISIPVSVKSEEFFSFFLEKSGFIYLTGCLVSNWVYSNWLKMSF